MWIAQKERAEQAFIDGEIGRTDFKHEMLSLGLDIWEVSDLVSQLEEYMHFKEFKDFCND